MNLTDFKTKQDLDNWGVEHLTTYNIRVSPETGNNRAAVILNFHGNFTQRQISIHVGVFELDNNGDPIIGKGINPYEEVIIANNDSEVDIETFQIVSKENQDPNKIYMGEYNAYVYYTKNNLVNMWGLFKNNIENSIKLKIIS